MGAATTERAPGTPTPTGSTPAPAIALRGVVKRFGRRTALAGIDLEVARGTVCGYLGPNGAGKTTTIRVLTGLLRPSAGQALVLGRDVGVERDEVQRRLGYLPGDFVAYPDLTGREYLHHLACLRGGVDPSVVTACAERLDADLDRRIGTLSHGNRQKIGVLQAFQHQPELLVLDEPTAGLDPLVQREFLAMVREARDAGRTVFLSSHVLSEVEQVADTVAILREGRLVVSDTVARLEQQVLRRLDLVLARTPPPAEELARLRGVREVRVTGPLVEATVEGSTADLLRTLAAYDVESVVSHEPDLEDVFLGWYARGGSR